MSLLNHSLQVSCSPAFSGYEPFLSELASLVSAQTRGRAYDLKVRQALNGAAYLGLRALNPIETLRAHGAFFTSSRLAKKLLRYVKSDSSHVFYDPCCGAGDLLLACTAKMESGRCLRETLDLWGEKLLGSDLQPQFVRATKLRLILAAQQRHKTERLSAEDFERAFPGVRNEDGLVSESYRYASVILLNPPFGQTDLSKVADWGRGRLTQSTS